MGVGSLAVSVSGTVAVWSQPRLANIGFQRQPNINMDTLPRQTMQAAAARRGGGAAANGTGAPAAAQQQQSDILGVQDADIIF